jgi:hypothetical protein
MSGGRHSSDCHFHSLHGAERETASRRSGLLVGGQTIASSGVTSGWLTQAQAWSGDVGSAGLAEQRALSIVAQSRGGAATASATAEGVGLTRASHTPDPENPFVITDPSATSPRELARIVVVRSCLRSPPRAAVTLVSMRTWCRIEAQPLPKPTGLSMP